MSMTYRVDKERRTVFVFSKKDEVAEFKSLIADIIDKTGFKHLSSSQKEKLIFSVYDNNIIIGEARCHPDDKFDVEIGKKIALQKYKRHVKNIKIQILKKLVRHMNKEVQQAHNIVDAKIRRLM